MAKNDNVTPLRPVRPCPNCGNPTNRSFYPFCSKRCSDLDLGQWLNGGYTIPVEEPDSGIPQGADEE